ncbi:hypothetical protein CUMW_033710 [Citrus unshiu]|nr:hypothetical protein CUMW_033710 [Citrus unshiu]
MGEEVRMTEYEVNDKGDYNGDDERIPEWEMGLPNGTDLTPLSQSLIPPELASAFSILPVPCRTHLDVNRASQTTLSSIRGSRAHSLSSTDNNNSNNLKTLTENRDPMVTETEEQDQNGSFADSRSKSRRPDCTEEADSALRTDNSNEDPSARTLKRPRLVWTPQLHKRFVDVVAHLGIKNAVPKTIMQLMNVEGLTRENVASHLQKYRLYLKRMQGLSNDDPSSLNCLSLSNLFRTFGSGGLGCGSAKLAASSVLVDLFYYLPDCGASSAGFQQQITSCNMSSQQLVRISVSALMPTYGMLIRHLVRPSGKKSQMCAQT